MFVHGGILSSPGDGWKFWVTFQDSLVFLRVSVQTLVIGDLEKRCEMEKVVLNSNYLDGSLKSGINSPVEGQVVEIPLFIGIF